MSLYKTFPFFALRCTITLQIELQRVTGILANPPSPSPFHQRKACLELLKLTRRRKSSTRSRTLQLVAPKGLITVYLILSLELFKHSSAPSGVNRRSVGTSCIKHPSEINAIVGPLLAVSPVPFHQTGLSVILIDFRVANLNPRMTSLSIASFIGLEIICFNLLLVYQSVWEHSQYLVDFAVGF